jgi:hypothetical protein
MEDMERHKMVERDEVLLAWIITKKYNEKGYGLRIDYLRFNRVGIKTQDRTGTGLIFFEDCRSLILALKNGGLKKEKVDCGYVVSFSKDLFKKTFWTVFRTLDGRV